jgi:hypothetical protein
MKTRNGFVSNSSASSFCIFGCVIENISYEEDCIDANNDFESLYDELYSSDKPKDVAVEIMEYDSNIYVGISPWKCRNDETMGQFKDRTKKTVTEFLKQHKIDTAELKFYEIEEAQGP